MYSIITTYRSVVNSFLDLKFYCPDAMLQDDAVIAGDSVIVTNEVTLGSVADGALAEHLMNMDLPAGPSVST